MQTDAVSQRITAAAHGYTVQLNTSPNQLVVEDWRLRNWVTDATAPAWAAPTTAYSIVSTAGQGDLVLKSVGTAVTYDQALNYDYPTDYNGVGGTGGYWDLGYQDLGVNTPVTLVDGVTTDTPYISSVSLSASKDLICFYSNRFRASYRTGIYVMRVVDNGNGNIYWSEPTRVFESAAIDEFNYQSQFFITFPRLQVINNEYWILALECSKEVNILTYHLCYFRSADGIHWSDREYLAGVSNDASEAAVGINQHDNGTAFTLNDLKHAYLTVSGNKVFMVSKAGSKFSCAATSLVGVTNPARQLDITPDVTSYSLSLPAAPSAAQGNYTIQNQYNKYNNNTLLVPGAKLTHKAGYVTSNGAELITVSQELIDEFKQSTQLDKNVISVTTADYTAWLRDWVSDMFWEYWSPQQKTYDQFCDLTALNVVSGRFFIGYGGTGSDLTAATLDPNDIANEDVGYVNPNRATDGSIEFQFKFSGSVSANVSVAAVFQGVSDSQFYSVSYNYALTAWVLSFATPSTAGKKLYTYTQVAVGSTDTIVADTWYWGKLEQWHNHVMFFTSVDRITWTTKLDYTAPVPPNNAAFPCNLGYFGLLGKSHSVSSGALGNTDASNGAVAMDSGGTPLYWATKFTTGPSAGTVVALAGLFTQTNTPPDLTIGLVLDNGGSPADVTNSNNVLYSTTVKSLTFSNSASPVWRAVPVPAYVTVDASTTYWIFWTFNSALSGGQTWEFYTGNGTASKTSVNGGVTWTTSAYAGAAIAFVDYDDGLVKFNAMYYTSAESPKTLDYLVKDVAAKASVLTCTVDSFLTDSDLVANWQPSSFGTLGDFVLEADVTGGPAEVYFRAQTNGDATTGMKVVIGSTITIYNTNVLKESIASMQAIPTTYHLTLSNQTGFIYIYINECLAATYYDSAMPAPGYFGVGVATFTNLRIPDMTSLKPYYVVESGKTALAALDDLIRVGRYHYFMRYDGTLRIGSFLRRTSVDTYYQTIIAANNVQSNRYTVNQLMPQGNYYAMRFAAYELDVAGRRRFKTDSYTDAVSNEAAYLAASNVLAAAREQFSQYSMDSNAVWPAERQDRITVVNPLDGTSQDYVITTLDWQYELQSGKSIQKTGLRNFVA
jgi:hypothetical protein